MISSSMTAILGISAFYHDSAAALVVDGEVGLVVDLYDGGSPLVGAITGFRCCRGSHALITACDMPFISEEAIRLLFGEVGGANGAVFRWPNGYIEPLIAVYRVKPSLRMAQELYEAGNLRLRMILLDLEDVRMIPIDALREIDPELLTLYDADTEDALLKAEKMLQKK